MTHYLHPEGAELISLPWLRGLEQRSWSYTEAQDGIPETLLGQHFPFPSIG